MQADLVRAQGKLESERALQAQLRDKLATVDQQMSGDYDDYYLNINTCLSQLYDIMANIDWQMSRDNDY